MKIHRPSGLPLDTSTLRRSDLDTIQATLEEIKRDLDDWPQLNYYKAANAKLKAASNNRVVFFGDSITEFWKFKKNGGFFPGKPYINRGIAGQTTSQMLVRLRADVIALKPQAMVLLAGTNDIAGNTGPVTINQIQDNIATIAELATLHKIKVVIASILPISNYHHGQESQTAIRPLEKIRQLNSWIKSYCKENGHVFLDYFSATVDNSGMLKKELSEDDLHPNALGYRIMTPLAEAAIDNALKSN